MAYLAPNVVNTSILTALLTNAKAAILDKYLIFQAKHVLTALIVLQLLTSLNV